MVGGLLASAASVLTVGAARGLLPLCLAVFVFGVVVDLFRPASQAAIADLVDEAHRQRAYALVFWAINLGFSVATFLGGVLADRSYWLLFGGDAATMLGFALIVLRGVPETRPVQASRAPGSMRDVLRDRLMLALVVSIVLQSMAYMQSFFTLPLAVVHDGLGAGGYGTVIALNGVLIVVLQPLVLNVLNRRNQGPLLLAASLVSGIGFGLTAFADSLLAHAACVAIWTLGEIMGAGILGALVARIAPVALRGRYMGVFGASFGMANMVAPGVGTQVYEHLGEGALWTGCLLVGTLSGLGLLLVSRAAQQR